MQTKFDVNKLLPASTALPDEIVRDIHAHLTAREKRQALWIGIEQGLKKSAAPWSFLLLFFVFTVPFLVLCILSVVLGLVGVAWDVYFYNRGAARLRAFLLSTEHSTAMKYDERFAEGLHIIEDSKG